MKKRIACKHLSLFLSILLLLGALVGCSDKSDPDATTGSTQGEENTSPSPEKMGSVFYGSFLLSGTGIHLLSYDDMGQIRRQTLIQGEDIFFANFKNVYDSSNKLTQRVLQPTGDFYDVENNFWLSYHYNDQNQLTDILYWLTETVTCSALYQESYSYDAQTGALTEKKITLSEETMLRNTYDASGRITEQAVSGEHILTYEYTASGNVARVFEYGATDTAHAQLLKTRLFTYDAKDQLTLYQAKDASGAVLEEHRFSYDGNGNLTSGLYTGEGSRAKFEHTYNSNGDLTRVLEHSSYGEGDWVEKTYGNYSFSYNEKGQLTSCERIHNGNTISVRYYTYDAAKRLVEERKITPHLDEDKLINSSVYEFSSDGHLQKATHFVASSAAKAEQNVTVTIEQENNVISRFLLTHQTGDVTEHRDIRISLSKESGHIRVTFSVFDENGKPLEQ